MALISQKTTRVIGAGALLAGLAYLLKTKQSMPARATAVRNFDLDRYLGTWYEIARLDYRFEKHFINVSATYTLNDNGSVKVDNKGYDSKHNKWKESVGVAVPVDKKAKDGRLKVSFFRPFYAAYNVIAIDDNYTYALVAGRNLDYLWLLSRERTMPEDVRNNYLRMAEQIGYNTDELIWTEQGILQSL